MMRGVALGLLVKALVITAPLLVVGRKRSSRGKSTSQEGLICHVERTLFDLDDGGNEALLECDVLSSADYQPLLDMSIAIELSEDFINNNLKALDAGSLYVHIPGGFVNEEFIEGFGTVGTNVQIPPGADISVLDATEVGSMWHQRRRHRRAFEQTGGLEGVATRTVMVFRVTTDDASPEVGATEIEERMFSPTSFSFASQFEKCSFGQLIFEPYDTSTPVLELYVPGKVSKFTERTILNAATRRAAKSFGSDIWDQVDHAIFCMPNGTSGKPYIAYSGVGSYFSVYHNVRCAYPTTVMHEIAHNCGLGHAFENGEEYADETTIMGFSSSSKTGPRKCFNGQNIRHFGWFKSRSVMVDPFQGHQLVELAPFVDFDKTNSIQAVLISILDMHVVYNRAKSFNRETSEYQNKVTIVREENEIDSALLAVLDMVERTFTLENFLGTKSTLVIELCESVVSQLEADYFIISIGLDYSLCSEQTPNPSTSKPTHFPTGSPTSLPTAQTTDFPSRAPTADFSSGSPSFKLPDIILVPFSTPPEKEITGNSMSMFEETTHIPNNSKEESGSLTITLSSLVPTVPPTIYGDESQAETSVLNSIKSSFNGNPRTVTTIVLASLLSILSSCCICVFIRWNKRRLDERKRNLRLMQYDASYQVKIYMKNPV